MHPGIGKAVRKNDWLETAALGWRPVAVWTSGREEVQSSDAENCTEIVADRAINSRSGDGDVWQGQVTAEARMVAIC